MIKQVLACGFDDCVKKIEENKGVKPIFIFFTGSEDPTTGQSWCPDCVNADPVIEAGLKQAPEDGVFILCQVGERDFWKDKNNAFRTSPEFRLTAVPTLLEYGGAKRLVEGQCADSKLVSMFFEED